MISGQHKRKSFEEKLKLLKIFEEYDPKESEEETTFDSHSEDNNSIDGKQND
jgi:hypothetical protein